MNIKFSCYLRSIFRLISIFQIPNSNLFETSHILCIFSLISFSLYLFYIMIISELWFLKNYLCLIMFSWIRIQINYVNFTITRHIASIGELVNDNKIILYLVNGLGFHHQFFKTNIQMKVLFTLSWKGMRGLCKNMKVMRNLSCFMLIEQYLGPRLDQIWINSKESIKKGIIPINSNEIWNLLCNNLPRIQALLVLSFRKLILKSLNSRGLYVECVKKWCMWLKYISC